MTKIILIFLKKLMESLTKLFDYKEVANQFNYYYNLWENDKLTFENPDAEEKFLNAVCISRIFAYGEKISEDVRKHGDTILERELKKLKDFKIKEKSNNEKSIFKMAEEDPGFKALLNVEFIDKKIL